MKGDRHPARLAITETREQVLAQLSDAFAKDELSLEEFEARVNRAYQASTEAGLGTLVEDLTPLTELAVAPAPVAALVVGSSSVRAPRVLAVLGNVERRGRFPVPDGYRATSVLGNVELDLRDVAFSAGVTHLHVRAVLGNVEIIVPPDLPVECEGSGILASFAALHRVPPEGREGGPSLRIIGSAVLGNVEIRTLPRGVSPHPSLREQRTRALPPPSEDAS
jgi:hypothetical protein